MSSSNQHVEVHTVRERFEKIQCLIDAIRQADDEISSSTYVNPMVAHQLANLDALADEAERCLEALRYEVF